MKNKKLLVVHLNEFNHILIYGAKKYNLKYLAKLLMLKSGHFYQRYNTK